MCTRHAISFRTALATRSPCVPVRTVKRDDHGVAADRVTDIYQALRCGGLGPRTPRSRSNLCRFTGLPVEREGLSRTWPAWLLRWPAKIASQGVTATSSCVVTAVTHVVPPVTEKGPDSAQHARSSETLPLIGLSKQRDFQGIAQSIKHPFARSPSGSKTQVQIY